MDIVEIVNAIRGALESMADEYLTTLENNNKEYKCLKEKIVFCQECKFARVDRSRVCGYYCGHPKHMINMECSSFDFCSFGVRNSDLL